MKTANIKKEYVIHNINKNYNSRSILKFILFYFYFREIHKPCIFIC